MHPKRWRQGPVVGLAAVILAVLIAQISVAGDSDERRIDRLERRVERLSAQLAGPAETAKKKKKKAKPGPAGPQGAQGPPGPAGSPAGGMLFGWVEPVDLPNPGSSRDYSPLGSGDFGVNVGAIPATPNSTVVLRDLFVKVLAPPGLMARWEFTLQGASGTEDLTCQIASIAATTCNSGAQTATIPPGGSIRLIIADAGSLSAAPTNVYYAYRVGSP